jgi:hypothetical protein
VIVEGSLPATLDGSAQEHHAQRARPEIGEERTRATRRGTRLACPSALGLVGDDGLCGELLAGGRDERAHRFH